VSRHRNGVFEMATGQRLRFVTAASLFDGHDVSINIMRRLLQANGVEVIHLGHNRSAQEVVDAVISEDAHAVALSSYQGGHMEYFTYIRELLNQAGAQHVRMFGGGGGVITPKEIQELHKRGITRIYHPKDGMTLGLNGIILDMIEKSQYSTLHGFSVAQLSTQKNLTPLQMAKVITAIENNEIEYKNESSQNIPVLGITGTGGAGKSSLIDELLLRFMNHYPTLKVALISVDPTKKKSQGALLGDRIRLGSAQFENIFVRSLATRDSGTELSPQIRGVVNFLKTQSFDLILVETSGIGQASDEITKVADKCLYVMTPEYGAQSQLEKIEMLESADFIALNKYEKPRSEDALRDIRKQYRRNHNNFVGHPGATADEALPIFGTMASRFNDLGVNALFKHICQEMKLQQVESVVKLPSNIVADKTNTIIGPSRVQYLREIAKTCFAYNHATRETVEKLKDLQALQHVKGLVDSSLQKDIHQKMDKIKSELDPDVLASINEFDQVVEQYHQGVYTYQVRGRDISVKTKFESLSHSMINRVAFPNFDQNELARKYQFIRAQNLPGFFPYSAGIFPFKREDEEPKRQFAGEGGPKRTNKRFHYLSANDESKRLSTAFDSVTLYGEDPDYRPDIFGKVGESGVSICTLSDMEQLFEGFDLTHSKTSVSKTINGPAPIILAMFMNAAINQKLKADEQLDEKKRIEIMRLVRGTVQADILKEDQAQNTCIFSLDFSLKLMGDVQEYFCKNAIKNYYTVSISGYHIAEAGANPITQLALTLSNGFTYVEYYLSRGLNIDDFCENLSFFFSNGLDPEYSVLGRVARKIWATTMKYRYGASEKSQKLKYHIQTSGRSLHAQEIDFNDIRTTLQAFLALSDNCNSLHTNAYDEAITTPTEESVRRAMAIQLIINREFGVNKCDNPLQGSYLIEELSELVETAVLKEFESISDRGGVLGAMESMYQRGKIQEESLHYETLKDSGAYQIIGVNTYIAPDIHQKLDQEIELSRASNAEKEDQINRLKAFKAKNVNNSQKYLDMIKQAAINNQNIFEVLLVAVRYCSLGEITNVLYQVGGKYRRNM
jgi:methylmalonyl-CoA mutase